MIAFLLHGSMVCVCVCVCVCVLVGGQLGNIFFRDSKSKGLILALPLMHFT